MRYLDQSHVYDLYEGSERILEEVPRCGWANFPRATASGMGFPETHPRVYEIIGVASGILRMRIEGRDYQARAREILFIRPGQAHAGVGPLNVIEPCELVWVWLDSARLKSSGQACGPFTAELDRRLSEQRSQVIGMSEATLSSLQRIVEEHRRREVFHREAARLAMHLAAICLTRDLGGAARVSVHADSAVARAIETIHSTLSEDTSDKTLVSALAKASGLSVAQFYRRFRREIGTTPADYRARCRVERAAELLAQDEESVTRIAMKLGFSSSQYFATVFRKYASMTPTTYRRRATGRERVEDLI